MYFILAIILSLVSILSTRLKNKNMILVISYLFFFISPVLSYFGIIGVLTGFDSIGTNGIYFGISFYTVYISYHLLKSREIIKSKPYNFLLSTINPIYLFTGPFPNCIPGGFKINNLKIFVKRFKIINSELILGIFFSLILAPSFTAFFSLKESFETLDIILFGIIFEIYVYFNFAGFSMISWSLMRLIGINVRRNFNQPFSGKSIVEYWQRWHISLSNILKELFFKNLKRKTGLFSSVFIVFSASALWHGVSVNFFIWGIFHALFWCTSYYFHKKKFKILNYFLLFFGVIFGRIIFSEINTDFLLIKVKSLFNIFNYKIYYLNQMNFSNVVLLSNMDLFNVFISMFIIFLEIVIPKFFPSYNNYYYLRTPIVSTIILIYIVLFFHGLKFEPIYGVR
jgi:alginate O-acetyltransferase complex protein AlgI